MVSYKKSETFRARNGARTYPLASFERRLIAWLLDAVPLYTFGGGLYFVTWKMNLNGLAAVALFCTLACLYYVGGIATFGTTPGKLICHLRVVTADGKTPSFGRMLLRSLLPAISSLLAVPGGFALFWLFWLVLLFPVTSILPSQVINFPLVTALGAILATGSLVGFILLVACLPQLTLLWGRRHQGLHDKLAGTYVIKTTL